MRLDDVLIWLFALGGSLAGLGARLTFLLARMPPEPPEDPKARAAWERKRRWLIISELSALPAFASLAMAVGYLQQWPVAGIVILSMVLGALGFAFLLDALKSLLRQRLGLKETPHA